MLTGLCTADATIYAPTNLPTAHGMLAACEAAVEAAIASGAQVAAHVALTHQLISEDRTLATAFAQSARLFAITFAILGGHEHDVFVERAADEALIVKMGADAALIGVVDIWLVDNKPRAELVARLPAAAFAADRELAAYQQGKDAWIK